MSPARSRQHVYLSSNLWTSLWITQQPICNEIQRTEPVLYVERFVSVFTIMRYPHLWPRLFMWLRGARRVTANLRLLAPLPLWHLGHRFPWLFRLEFQLQRWWIRRWASAVASGEGRVCWIDNPLYECALGTMGETISVYHVADEVAAFPSSHPETMDRLERAALAKADLVFAAAEQLAEDKRRHHERVHTVLNAIDQTVFAVPAGGGDILTGIPEPRAAFVGVLDTWVDTELLETAARRLTSVHFVIVGDSRVNDAALRRLSNVHWLGRRDRGAVPAILRGCSASLIPFKQIPLTARILPLKVFEALAAGILPVCTPFSADLDRLERDGYVAVGRDSEAFISMVARAVAQDTSAQRSRLSAYGLEQTWAQRWAQMDQVLQHYAKTKGARGSS